MKCPNCSHDMVLVKYENVTIDECPGCGGVWLDDRELNAIIADGTETFSAEEKNNAVRLKGLDRPPKTLACPKCQAPMKVVNYAYNSGVFIDSCPNNHGVWLDKGELVKIQILMDGDRKYMGEPCVDPPLKVGGRRCPRDGSALQEVRYETEAIDLCPQCGGVWCDYDELSKIVRARDKVFRPEDHADIVPQESAQKVQAITEIELATGLDCIICNKAMRRLIYSYTSGVIIDRCPDGHGVWLDRDELERIQIFVERWENMQGAIDSRYPGLIKKAGQETAMSYNRAVWQGAAKGIRASIFGRIAQRIAASK